MVVLKGFWFVLLIVGTLKVSCFPSGGSQKLDGISLKGIQVNLDNGGSPATTTSVVTTHSPVPTHRAASVVTTDSPTDTDDFPHDFVNMCDDCTFPGCFIPCCIVCIHSPCPRWCRT
ncbi:hypothetical protein DPEC_G00022030 [Dallia pectoralis]|uniref:Uncharacterized protein n=1 Tax=Dallia pectoralis TaxID=75939 RepID=A0ACC2HH12_DALPE|nr:hypothetical protein DPEC_G00022030 [Dallia pectoralis]